MVDPDAHAHRTELAWNLYGLMKDSKYCDLILSSAGEEFYCHKLVVAAACPVLRQVLFNQEKGKADEMMTLCMDFVEPRMLELLLKFFYTGETPQEGEDVDGQFSFLQQHLNDTDCEVSKLDLLEKRTLSSLPMQEETNHIAIVEISHDDDFSLNETQESPHMKKGRKQSKVKKEKGDSKQQTKNKIILPKEPPFLCPSDSCGKIFETREKLRSHYRHNHGEKRFKCNQCPLRFLYPKDLTCHLRTHTGEKPFICDTCGRGFAQLGSMHIHTKVHAKQRVSHDHPSYPCPDCIKTFVKKERQDVAVVENIAELDLATLCCPNENCAKKFSSPQSLRKHIKNGICSVIKWSCASCKTDFDSSQELRKHVATNHCTHKRPAKKRPRYGEPSPLLQCAMCETSFETLVQLQDHMYKHEGVVMNCEPQDEDPTGPPEPEDYEQHHELMELCTEVEMGDGANC